MRLSRFFILATFPLSCLLANEPLSEVEIDLAYKENPAQESPQNQENQAPPPKCPQKHEIMIEAKTAYFYPTSSRFRDIYGPAGIYGLEASFQASNNLYAWLNGNYFYKKGHSLGSHNSTSLFFVPIGLGLKFLLNHKYCDFYLSAGMVTTYIHIRNNSPFVVSENNKWTVGANAGLGLIINFGKSIFLDLFANYLFLKTHFSHSEDNDENLIFHKADLSGTSVGAGLGYRF